VEALQAATLNPARFLGREHDFGTVATGEIADLVLLDDLLPYAPRDPLLPRPQ
jgi:imidazolonepropionase-like amidohydrolase